MEKLSAFSDQRSVISFMTNSNMLYYYSKSNVIEPI
jgi:hypothetical protein